MLTRVVGRMRSRAEEARLSEVARRVRKARLTYLSPTRLRTLERCAERIDRERVPGDVVEAGVALGGSAVLLASLCPDRTFHGYDVFAMIPPPGEQDPPEVHERYATIVSGRSEGIGGDQYYGYRADLFGHVTRTFADFGRPVGTGVHLHKGLFEDTLHPTAPVALAHIDSDWYAPVRLCLHRLGPVMSDGGLIVLDDFHDYGGCAKAAEEFMRADPAWRVVLDNGNVVLGRG
jgi:O-methyltransferase